MIIEPPFWFQTLAWRCQTTLDGWPRSDFSFYVTWWLVEMSAVVALVRWVAHP
jgi:hypothetical protein